MNPPPLSQAAVSYTWHQLADRAGIRRVTERVTGFETLDIPVSYGTASEARLSKPGLVVCRCADSDWNTLPIAAEDSLRRIPAADTIPAGGRLPFANPVPVLLWGKGCGETRKPFAERLPNGSILFYVDILASTFFMLSRVEETLPGPRDEHGRFQPVHSTAYRQGFLNIPIVDQYALILREWIRLLVPGWKPEPLKLKVKITHDIDWVQKFASRPSYLRSVGASLLKERSAGRFLADVSAAGRILSSKLDPYYLSIDRLSRESLHRGFTGSFYFMAARPSQYQSGYDPSGALVREVLGRLRKAGHTIGIHPGYATFDDPGYLQKEKQRLEAALNQKVIEGRQHYLRFRVPQTWRHWEQAGLESDSTMGYAEHEGFRCGTCWPYSPFDVEQDRELNLKEIPLVVMDVTLRAYRQLSPAQAQQSMLDLAARCAEVGGTFTILWHNSSLAGEWKPWFHAYVDILEHLSKTVGG